MLRKLKVEDCIMIAMIFEKSTQARLPLPLEILFGSYVICNSTVRTFQNVTLKAFENAYVDFQKKNLCDCV